MLRGRCPSAASLRESRVAVRSQDVTRYKMFEYAGLGVRKEASGDRADIAEDFLTQLWRMAIDTEVAHIALDHVVDDVLG
ncbi:hypothetical protein AWC21_00915 [Mycolicibacterium peregrinum]|nr:hypothetical protein AWC21_00915 [Mycolicibacterium peregrinum]